jgi:uncharacterized membrane protein YuzA (DUF378 family)
MQPRKSTLAMSDKKQLVLFVETVVLIGALPMLIVGMFHYKSVEDMIIFGLIGLIPGVLFAWMQYKGLIHF